MATLSAMPRLSSSIILERNVPSLRVRFCSFMKDLAFFHLPFSSFNKKMQSIAWSFSKAALIAESLWFVSIFLILASDNRYTPVFCC